MARSNVWVASLLILCLLATPVFAQDGPLLPKPSWVRCTWQGQDYVCLDLDQSKHYLELYVRYKDQHSRITLLDQELELKAKYEKIFIEDVHALMKRVDSSNIIIKDFQEFVTAPDLTPYSFTSVLFYTIITGVGALGFGIVVGFALR